MSKESSKQDSIARQFDLPERQSKIATLLKENDVYCICRSSDSTRFMIACDNCEEWYHGDCIKITDAEAKRIKHYFCTFCREHNPALRIEYKKPKAPPTSVPNKVERPLASANFNVESSPPPSSHNGNTNSKERKPGRPKKIHSEHSSKSAEKSKEKETSRKSNRKCGFCAGCTLEEDCGKCDNCKSNARRRKYDANAKSSKKCRQKQCLNTAKRPRTYSYDSDDYVPDEEVVPPTAAARALKYNSDTDSADEGDVVVPKSRKKEKEKSSKRSSKPPKVSSQSQPTETKTKKVKKLHKIRTGELWEEWSSAGEISEEDPGGQQCIGPECINETRPNSKYCSDECGLKMASARIYNVLPGRIQEWSLTPCTAEEHNKKTLEENRSKQQDTRKRIKHLEDRRTSLDNHIELISKLKVDPKSGDDEPDDDGSIYCITCGHEIPIKTCLKHMEKCYNKYESQTSFASGYLTRLEGVPIFCDSFNIVAGTYCKRLKVLCPEHTKEPKVRETAVCGCPLVKNMSTTDQFCQIAKKKCNRHFCWEKLRRAEIDIQRVSCWMKLDELLEQERTIRQAMTNRAGVMALMLHSTFDHELRARIHRQMEDEQRQRERRLSREKERSMAQKRNAIRSGPVKPVIEMDMDEIIFKEPLPSKRDKANRRPPVVIKTEAEEYSSQQQMTASKLYYKQMTESDS